MQWFMKFFLNNFLDKEILNYNYYLNLQDKGLIYPVKNLI